MVRRKQTIKDVPEHVNRAFNDDVETYSEFINALHSSLMFTYKGEETLYVIKDMLNKKWQELLCLGQVVGKMPEYDLSFSNGTIYFDWKEKENKQ